jgi:membrane protein DedA with SNARE-associated domain
MPPDYGGRRRGSDRPLRRYDPAVHGLAATVSKYGLPLVFANVLLEQLGLPIPAVPTLIVAGALSVEKDVSAAAVLGVALVACLIADSVWYALGARHGFPILKTLCRVSLSPDSCVRQTTAAFERWGMPSLLVAKFIPGFSTVAPPLAGAVGRRPLAFLAFDAGGSLLWAGSAVLLGALFHKAIDHAIEYLAGIGGRAVVLMATALALFIAWKWWQRRRFYRALRMARITPAELHELRSQGSAPVVVVDVRTSGSRVGDPRRIPGASAMTFDEIAEKASSLPRDREIVLYCT